MLETWCLSTINTQKTFSYSYENSVKQDGDFQLMHPNILINRDFQIRCGGGYNSLNPLISAFPHLFIQDSIALEQCVESIFIFFAESMPNILLPEGGNKGKEKGSSRW